MLAGRRSSIAAMSDAPSAPITCATRMLRTAVLAAALLGAACDPAFVIEGSVKSPAGALAGADVTLSCPSDPPLRLTTDAHGRIFYHRIGTANPECRVVVSKQGFRPRELTLAEVCNAHFGVGCRSARIDVELAPAEPAP